MATNQQLPPAMFQPKPGDAIQLDPSVPGGYLNTRTGQHFAPGTLWPMHVGGKDRYMVTGQNGGNAHSEYDPQTGAYKDSGGAGSYWLRAAALVGGAALGAGAWTAAASGGGSAAGGAAASSALPTSGAADWAAAQGGASALAPAAGGSAISAFQRWSPWLSAASSVYGAYQQGQATDADIAEKKREFDIQAAFNQQQADLAKARHEALVAREQPYVSGGTAAYGRLGDLLGLSPSGSLSGPSQQPAPAQPPPSAPNAPDGTPPVSPTNQAPPTPPTALAAPTPMAPQGMSAPMNTLASFAQGAPVPQMAQTGGVKFRAPDGSVATLTNPADITKAQQMGLQRVA